MNTFSSIARDFNVRLISVSPGNEENQPLYIKTPFTLVIGADSYHTIGKFISSLENQPGIYFVETISIRSQEESRTPAQELTQEPKLADKLIVNLILSIIAFKG
jgi:Tfp pilus assembly protein PilO